MKPRDEDIDVVISVTLNSTIQAASIYEILSYRRFHNSMQLEQRISKLLKPDLVIFGLMNQEKLHIYDFEDDENDNNKKTKKKTTNHGQVVKNRNKIRRKKREKIEHILGLLPPKTMILRENNKNKQFKLDSSNGSCTRSPKPRSGKPTKITAIPTINHLKTKKDKVPSIKSRQPLKVKLNIENITKPKTLKRSLKKDENSKENIIPVKSVKLSNKENLEENVRKVVVLSPVKEVSSVNPVEEENFFMPPIDIDNSDQENIISMFTSPAKLSNTPLRQIENTVQQITRSTTRQISKQKDESPRSRIRRKQSMSIPTSQINNSCVTDVVRDEVYASPAKYSQSELFSSPNIHCSTPIRENSLHITANNLVEESPESFSKKHCDVDNYFGFDDMPNYIEVPIVTPIKPFGDNKTPIKCSKKIENIPTESTKKLNVADVIRMLNFDENEENNPKPFFDTQEPETINAFIDAEREINVLNITHPKKPRRSYERPPYLRHVNFNCEDDSDGSEEKVQESVEVNKNALANINKTPDKEIRRNQPSRNANKYEKRKFRNNSSNESSHILETSKSKKPVRKKLNKQDAEFEKWAKEFNAQCGLVESFDLCVE